LTGLLIGAAALAAGCGAPAGEGNGDGDGGASGAPSTFIAFGRDFTGYKSWTRYEMAGVPAAGAVHTAGTRVVYVNRVPAAGAQAFPVGTMIVKEMMDTGEIFARAKRGGDFNKSGASGWEWFDLKNDPAGVIIVWRGIAPPAGSCAYGAVVGGVCNDCHGAARTNDFVLSAALQLGAP
jgi:hypothetical protein